MSYIEKDELPEKRPDFHEEMVRDVFLKVREAVKNEEPNANLVLRTLETYPSMLTFGHNGNNKYYQITVRSPFREYGGDESQGKTIDEVCDIIKTVVTVLTKIYRPLHIIVDTDSSVPKPCRVYRSDGGSKSRRTRRRKHRHNRKTHHKRKHHSRSRSHSRAARKHKKYSRRH